MNSIQRFGTGLLVLLFALGSVVACDRSAAERDQDRQTETEAEQEAEEAAEETEEAVEEGAEETEGPVDKAAEETEEALEETEEAAEEGAEETGEWIEGAAEDTEEFAGEAAEETGEFAEDVAEGTAAVATDVANEVYEFAEDTERRLEETFTGGGPIIRHSHRELHNVDREMSTYEVAVQESPERLEAEDREHLAQLRRKTNELKQEQQRINALEGEEFKDAQIEFAREVDALEDSWEELEDNLDDTLEQEEIE